MYHQMPNHYIPEHTKNNLYSSNQGSIYKRHQPLLVWGIRKYNKIQNMVITKTNRANNPKLPSYRQTSFGASRRDFKTVTEPHRTQSTPTPLRFGFGMANNLRLVLPHHLPEMPNCRGLTKATAIPMKCFHGERGDGCMPAIPIMRNSLSACSSSRRVGPSKVTVPVWVANPALPPF